MQYLHGKFRSRDGTRQSLEECIGNARCLLKNSFGGPWIHFFPSLYAFLKVMEESFLKNLYKSLFREDFRKLKYEGTCRMQIVCPVGDYFALELRGAISTTLVKPSATVKVKANQKDF